MWPRDQQVLAAEVFVGLAVRVRSFLLRVQHIHPRVMGCGASTPAAPGLVTDSPTEPIAPSANVVEPQAQPPAAEPVAVDDEGPEPGDQDDLDGLDEMADKVDNKLVAKGKAVFEKLDTDGSGHLSKAELKVGLLEDESIRDLLGDSVEGALTKFDLDGDDEITWQEFEEVLCRAKEPDAMDLMTQEADANDQLLQSVRALFERLDTDGDGSISRTELREGLAADKEAQQLLGDRELMAMRRLDLDGDGEITWEEFSSVLAGD